MDGGGHPPPDDHPAHDVDGIGRSDVETGHAGGHHQRLAQPSDGSVHVGVRRGHHADQDRHADKRKARGLPRVGQGPQAGVEPDVADHVGPQDPGDAPSQEPRHQQVAGQTQPASDQRGGPHETDGPQGAQPVDRAKHWHQAAGQRSEESEDVELGRAQEVRGPQHEDDHQYRGAQETYQVAGPPPVELLRGGPERPQPGSQL